MYHNYFGIDDQAFSIAVNPRYMYMSEQHKEALAHLLYGVQSGGFVMLSGEVGTGKTTIIRCLLEQLPDEADVAIVLNPSANSHDLICSICDEFKISYDPNEKSLKVLIDALAEFLVANHHRGRKSIVLIDEAQLLRVSTLEQVRLLTNLETNTQKLLQIILVGQPELNSLLAKPDLRQLSQRITARYHLRPLSEKETQAYIKHRLAVAGMPPGRQPFNARIFHRIYQITHGIPRLINVLCDRMLLGAYSRDTTVINSDICRQAALEVLGEIPATQNARRQQWAIGAIAGMMLCALVAMLVWLWWDNDGGAVEPALAAPEPVRTAPAAAEVTGAAQQAPVRQAHSGGPYWSQERNQALANVAHTLTIPLRNSSEVCAQLQLQGWQCETEQLDTWSDIRSIDRAGVLTITTEARQRGYVALVGLGETEARVQTDQGIQTVDLLTLGQRWDGRFTYIWRKPAAFTESIGRGTKSALVSWVAEQFAALDGQNAPLTQNFYNEKLQQRVEIFQRANNLEDDGYVGLKTLLKLNAVRGLETPLSQMPAVQGMED